jgi:hypothetical protein
VQGVEVAAIGEHLGEFRRRAAVAGVSVRGQGLMSPRLR